MSGGRHLVVGAGLGGALMAVYLGRAGHPVTVYEARPDPRRGPAAGGRSINLALSTRGLQALARAGLEEAVLAGSVPMRGRMIHGPTGELTFQPYGTEPHEVIRSVSRAGLNRLLVEAAEAQPGVGVVFGRKCVGVDLEGPAAQLMDIDSGAVERVEADVVVGADGAFSAVRAQMQRLDRFDYRQDYLAHGYKELSIPPREGGGFAMEPEALHIWPRGQFMMIALPNQDGSFTCTLFWPFEGAVSFAALRSGPQVREFFRRTFPDALPLMPTLEDDYLRNPSSSLVTVRCRPWHVGDRVVLLGDACHAVVPFYGQGANASFEDCLVLDEALARHAGDRARAFAEYEARRKEHVDVLADLAVANFLEMRDRTASGLFHAKKLLERTLHRLLPRWFVPLYTLVTFTRVPYGEAVARARRQWRLVSLAAALVMALAAVAALLARSRAWR